MGWGPVGATDGSQHARCGLFWWVSGCCLLAYEYCCDSLSASPATPPTAHEPDRTPLSHLPIIINRPPSVVRSRFWHSFGRRVASAPHSFGHSVGRSRQSAFTMPARAVPRWRLRLKQQLAAAITNKRRRQKRHSQFVHASASAMSNFCASVLLKSRAQGVAPVVGSLRSFRNRGGSSGKAYGKQRHDARLERRLTASLIAAQRTGLFAPHAAGRTSPTPPPPTLA